ncbi:MATE family efflux transporter [Odoribacter sp. OttesenSCG-928-L07]|nr:MATE family efflux transporter [Odoribacter sp. OttesenSCG-928-L07]MDL2238913.1 MATE family efflux transporter [Bacteroidales bacterium OttesenSCG-928-L14]
MKEDLSNPLSLGTAKVSKLLMHYALPAIIAMITSSLYNIVDSIFIGHGVGAMAISGLAISFPLMNISAALGSMIGVGAASLMSIKMGQKDFASAEKILGNTVILNIFIGILQLIFFLIWLKPILILFGAGEETLPYAYDYMKVLVIGNVITHLYFGLIALLRSSGYPRMAMNVPIITIIFNCIMDALFIFVFKMGIFGAALATILAQVLGLSISVYHFSKKSSFVHFKKGIFKFEPRLSKEIIVIGTAPFLLNLCSSVVVIFINNSLKKIGGDISIGAYGIVNRFGMLFVMIINGISQGMQPIIGYNYGAKKYDRLKSVMKMGTTIATIVVCIGAFLSIVFPYSIARMFTTDPTLLEVSKQGLRITNMAFPVVGFSIVISNFFQSIGKPTQAIFLSLTRQMIFLVPLLVILPPLFDSTLGVWLSIPISDVASSILAIILVTRQMRKLDAEGLRVTSDE